MSSANCCMTQKSPSPNNLAPRPVRLQYPLGQHRAASRTSTDNLSLASAASPLSRPDDIAELQAIFEEGKAPIDDGNKRPKAKQSSASLTSVKNKLKNHLSRELKVHKRQSRSSIGTSEEDIDRKAELRRIRHRRIQEELSNDLGYDSDAKSLPTITGVDSASEDPQYPQTPALSPVSQLSPYLNERGQQLEARLYEISPSKCFTSPQTTQSEYNVTDSSNIVNTPGTEHSQRHSSPSLISLGTVIDSPDQPTQLSSSEIPSAPALRPQRLASFLSKSSWRLSFASENRGAYLRSLSQDETPTAQAKAITSAQPIKRWLRSQGLRSTSQALTWSDDNSIRALSASHSQNGSIDHVNEAEAPSDSIHLEDMVISQRLATRLQSPVSAQQLFNVEHGLEYHDPSNAGYTVDRSPTARKFPLIKHYTLGTNDDNISSFISDAESLREKGLDIGISRKPSINVPAFDTPRFQVPSEIERANPQLLLTRHMTPRVKLAPITKSYDGSMEEAIRLPPTPCRLAIPPYSEDNSHTTGRTHHLVDDEISGEWSKAAYLNTRSKDKQILHSLVLPSVRKISTRRDNRKSDPAEDKLKTKAIESCSLDTNELLKSDNSKKSYNTLSAQKGEYFSNWREKLKPVTQTTESEGNNAVKSSIPDRRYPASWSKFSSHGRRERTESATVDDLVNHVDFAIASVQDGETVWYVNERSNHLYHHEGDDHESHRTATRNGFFEKWEKKIKDKFHQVETVHTDVFLDRTRGRRGSLVPSLPVEYPELELLPGDLMTAVQIESYVKDQLEEEEIQRQKEELKAIFSTEVTRQGSLAIARRPSKWETEADNPKKEQPAPELIELDNLTPTKSIAQRSEARGSRKKAAKNIMPRSSMRVREQANTVGTGIANEDHLQLAEERYIQMNLEHSVPRPIDDRIAGVGTSSKNLGVFDKSKKHPEVSIENENGEKYLRGMNTEIGSSGYYNDCIVSIAPDEVDYTESVRFQEELQKRAEKKTLGTWSPGDWDEYKDNAEANDTVRRPISLGHLRKSTDDFHLELQKMERLEREKALRIVKEVWGSGQ